MHLKKLAVRNFRRLQNVVIDLASDITIFVGANNSGKTSVGHALQMFTGHGRFNIHDFSAELWPSINAFGTGNEGVALPSVEVDIWLEIGVNDVHRVIDLLPSLAWDSTLVGMRVAFAPIDPEATRDRYTQARERALAAVDKDEHSVPVFDPAPRHLCDFLRDHLNDEYELRYFLLDPAKFDANMVAVAGYAPASLTGRDRSGREILNGILRIDFLNAQRHLSVLPEARGRRTFHACSAASTAAISNRRARISTPSARLLLQRLRSTSISSAFSNLPSGA